MHSILLHPNSSTIAGLRTERCSAFDVVLPRCEFQAGCSGCSKEMKIDVSAKLYPVFALYVTYIHGVCTSSARGGTTAIF